MSFRWVMCIRCTGVSFRRRWREGRRGVFFLPQMLLFQNWFLGLKTTGFLILYLCLGPMKARKIYHYLAFTMIYYYALTIVVTIDHAGSLSIRQISTVPLTNGDLKLTRPVHYLLTNTDSCVELMQ